MPAALGAVGLGALDPEEPEPDALLVETEREPVGLAAPTKEPVRGPGPAEATAPDPLRAPVGTGGSREDALKLAVRAWADSWKVEKLVVLTLIPLGKQWRVNMSWKHGKDGETRRTRPFRRSSEEREDVERRRTRGL